jgi:hypothetical protein
MICQKYYQEFSFLDNVYILARIALMVNDLIQGIGVNGAEQERLLD